MFSFALLITHVSQWVISFSAPSIRTRTPPPRGQKRAASPVSGRPEKAARTTIDQSPPVTPILAAEIDQENADFDEESGGSDHSKINKSEDYNEDAAERRAASITAQTIR